MEQGGAVWHAREKVARFFDQLALTLGSNPRCDS
jgi:hypothetical protein